MDNFGRHFHHLQLGLSSCPSIRLRGLEGSGPERLAPLGSRASGGTGCGGVREGYSVMARHGLHHRRYAETIAGLAR